MEASRCEGSCHYSVSGARHQRKAPEHQLLFINSQGLVYKSPPIRTTGHSADALMSSSHFTERKTEVQEGQDPCPRSPLVVPAVATDLSHRQRTEGAPTGEGKAGVLRVWAPGKRDHSCGRTPRAESWPRRGDRVEATRKERRSPGGKRRDDMETCAG